MPATRFLAIGLLALVATLAMVQPGRSAIENVNMAPRLSVENGHLVVHWGASGFGHYNIRWSTKGGAPQQIERDGDKDFVYVTTFARGLVYSVAVQGCDSRTLARSQCTSWDEVSCGQARAPCDGPPPRPIINGGGLCLDVHAPDQGKDGGRVQLWQCNGSDQQLWTQQGPRIVSLAGKCLDANLGTLKQNGGAVQVWACNGSVQQRWSWTGAQVRSGGGKCLDANLGALRQNGDVVQLWDCNKAVQQRWRQPDTL